MQTRSVKYLTNCRTLSQQKHDFALTTESLRKHTTREKPKSEIFKFMCIFCSWRDRVIGLSRCFQFEIKFNSKDAGLLDSSQELVFHNVLCPTYYVNATDENPAQGDSPQPIHFVVFDTLRARFPRSRIATLFFVKIFPHEHSSSGDRVDTFLTKYLRFCILAVKMA